MFENELTITIFGALLSLVVSFLTKFLFDKQGKNKKLTLEERVKVLTASLTKSAELIGQVELEISEKEKLVEKLRKDAETYNALLSLKKNEVDAITNVINNELRVQGKKSFWSNFIVNFLFFIAGAMVSFLITILTKG